MKKLYNFVEFITEGTLLDTSRKIDINFKIEGDDHFYDRLSRPNNEPDENGDIIIDEDEVLNDIKTTLNKIVTKTLFNNGLYWLNKTNYLNKDILIINSKTKLNTILSISKERDKYLITIKSVMRKTNFKPSAKENTEVIYI